MTDAVDKAALTQAVAALLDEYGEKLAAYADAQLDLEIIAGREPASIHPGEIVTKAVNWLNADYNAYYIGLETAEFLAANE